MDEQTIRQRISTQRDFFATGATLPLSFRLKQLEQLKLALKHHEQDLYTALKADLGKSRMESYMCEIGLTLSELTWMQKHLPKLMRCKTVPTPLAHFAAKSFQSPSPYGTVLIMSPWNYPVLLTWLHADITRGRRRSFRRRKYRHPEAKRLRSTHQSDSEPDPQGMLSAGICNDDHRRPGRKSGALKPAF